MSIVLRCCAVIAAAILAGGWSLVGGVAIKVFADFLYPPTEAINAADSYGRGLDNAVDLGPGIFIVIVLAVVGGWLGWVWSSPSKWSTDLFVGTPIFLGFAAITAANYMHLDMLYTANAQAVINVLLVAAGTAIVAVLRKNLASVHSVFLKTLGTLLIMIWVFAFIAVPAFYTASFVSWKMGMGKFSDFDEAKKIIAGALSFLAVLGIQIIPEKRRSQEMGS